MADVAALRARYAAGRRAVIYQLATGGRDHNAPVLVCSIQTAVRRAGSLGMFDFIVIDECLPANTLIDGRPIETSRPLAGAPLREKADDQEPNWLCPQWTA